MAADDDLWRRSPCSPVPNFHRDRDGRTCQYAPIIVSIMPGHTYEKGIDEFFKSVIATCARAQDGLALKTLVDQLNVERADPDISAWRPNGG